MSDANKCMTSIILVVFNDLDYTKQCVESVRRQTEQDSYELIVVNNGSIDDTLAWAQNQSDIIFIHNEHKVGFSRAYNQGVAAASGTFIMRLNATAVAAPGWLDALKRCLTSDDRIGAVAPVTNLFSYLNVNTMPISEQKAGEMELLAAALHANPDKTKWEERVNLGSDCLLMRREACEKVGPFDENLGTGTVEELDYSLRMRLAGYKLMLCGDAFIQHEGSTAGRDAGQSLKRTISHHTTAFTEKWGFEPAEAAYIRTDLSKIIQRESHGYKRAACAIMEIGCGCGATLLHLRKQFPKATWYGVELNQLAANVAEASGIKVFRSNDPLSWSLPEDGLDGMIIGDAEGYGAPQRLKQLQSLLRPNGWLICSYANRYYSDNVRQYLDPENEMAQQQAAKQYTMKQVDRLYIEAGFSSVKVMLDDNKPEGQQPYLTQLDQLTGRTMTEQLAAAHIFVYSRVAAAEQQV